MDFLTFKRHNFFQNKNNIRAFKMEVLLFFFSSDKEDFRLV